MLIVQILRSGAIILVLFMLAIGVTMTSPAQTARAALAPSGVTKIFGMDGEGVVAWGLTDDLASTGVNWVRVDVSWAGMEPTPGVYDLRGATSRIQPLIDAGLSPVVYVWDTPKWAGKKRCGPVNTKDPTLVQAFANAMGELAKNFPETRVWGLYNEIDRSKNLQDGAGCFGSHEKGGVNKNDVPDFQEYAIMLAAARKAVHAANPSAKLAIGALAYDNFDEESAPINYPGHGKGGAFNYQFLDDLLQYMNAHPLPPGEKYMDMVLFNYYDIYGGHYWGKYFPGYGIQSKKNALTAKLGQYGFAKTRLFVTETGVNSYDVGERLQAHCVGITYVRAAAAKLKGLIWWTFRDYPTLPPTATSTWKYGIFREDNSPKKSFTALQTLTTELNGFKLKKGSPGGGFQSIEAYRFGQGSTIKFVVWSASVGGQPYTPQCAWPRNLKTATFDAKTIRVVKDTGKDRTIKDNGNKDQDKTKGKIAITVGGAPLIVQINPQ